MPRGFVFKLERVLEQRVREEQARQRAMAELQRERSGIEQAIRGAQSAIAASKQDLRQRLSTRAPVGLDSVRLQARSSLTEMARAQTLVLELAALHSRIESERALLAEATARRRAIELLRERALEEWKALGRKREQAELDELVVMRHAR